MTSALRRRRPPAAGRAPTPPRDPVTGRRAAPRVALVLAGRRSGEDAVARAAGLGHKALVPVAGRPMLLRVIDALRALPRLERLLVSSDTREILEADPELRELLARGVVEHVASADSPARSVRDGLERLEPPGPLLVTTADHPLLTPGMLEHFCDAAEASGADVVAGVVEERVVRARYPEARRTFVPLRGGPVTGANLFWFRSAAGGRAAEFWRHTEAVRKRPWRLAAVLGLRTLLDFALRRLDLERALARLSDRLGLRVSAVRMPFAECGLDVDRPEHLALAGRVLAARARETEPDRTRGCLP